MNTGMRTYRLLLQTVKNGSITTLAEINLDKDEFIKKCSKIGVCFDPYYIDQYFDTIAVPEDIGIDDD